ncbi:flippase [Methanobacterium sp.]|uniref:flippase n=1 Tax=Methanobacterium sp. TaxID=2164 RepID=UPI003C76AC8A
MSTVRKIVKNTSVLFIAQIISYVFAFVYTIYSAQYLGAEGFGVLSLAIAFTGIFGVLADFGLATLVVREVARNKSLVNKYLGNALSIKIILAILTIGLTSITLNIMGYPQQTIYVTYLITFSVIITAFSQIFYSIFQAYEKMEYQSIGTILYAALILLGILLAIYYKLDILAIALVYFVSSLIVLACNLSICAWKFVLPRLKVDFGFWKSTLKEAWPFAITTISVNIYTWIDTILLSLLIGELVVGWYTAAYRLIIVLFIIPIIFNTAVFPVMSRYYVSSKESLRFSFEKYFKFIMLIGFPLGIGTTLLADKVILLIYGNQYLNSIIALQILIWTLVIVFARSPFERLLEASNRQLTVTKVFIIGVIFNVTANLIVIPKFSYVGSAVITVLTDLLVISLLIYIVKGLGITISRNILLNMGKIVFASFVMGIFIYILNMNLIISAVTGVLIYVIILLILKILDEDEINMIKSILNK